MQIAAATVWHVQMNEKWSYRFSQPVQKNGCKFRLKKTKVHLTAKKKMPGVSWTDFEVTNYDTASTTATPPPFLALYKWVYFFRAYSSLGQVPHISSKEESLGIAGIRFFYKWVP